MKGLLVLLVCTLATFSSGLAAPVPVRRQTAITSYSDIRFNFITAKSNHNSYQRWEPIYDQLSVYNSRSLEADLHTSKPLASAVKNNWYIWHEIYDFAITNTDRLNDWLDSLVKFHNSNPNHEVVVSFFDLKDEFDADHTPQNVDDRILEKMSRSMVYAPTDMLKRLGSSATWSKNNLMTSVAQTKWPLLSELKGKFIFVFTGREGAQNTYRSAKYVDGQDPLVYLMPEAGSVAEVSSKQSGHTVFFNMDVSNSAWPSIADEVKAKGYVSRIYQLGTSSQFSAAKGRVNHLATDFFRDSWSQTTNGNKFPFAAMNGYTFPADLKE
ncbi:hypothetical protein BJ742DRAFT_777156 [Cladochytrium replicatum]|nr:hypothetical protein BJ742DRAFT_777156 [Cladochytrium replicatum]